MLLPTQYLSQRQEWHQYHPVGVEGEVVGGKEGIISKCDEDTRPLVLPPDRKHRRIRDA